MSCLESRGLFFAYSARFFTTQKPYRDESQSPNVRTGARTWLRLQETRMDTTTFDRTGRTNHQTPCKAQCAGFFSFCGAPNGICRKGYQSVVFDDLGSVVSCEANKDALGVAEMFKPALYSGDQVRGGRFSARRIVEFDAVKGVLKVARTDTKSVWCGQTREPRETVCRSGVIFENGPVGQMHQRMHKNRYRQENGKDLLCGSRNKILH